MREDDTETKNDEAPSGFVLPLRPGDQALSGFSQLLSDNPLLKLNHEQMEQVQDRAAVCQRVVAGAIRTGMMVGSDVATAAALAIQVLVEVALRTGDRDLAGALVLLGEALANVPGGPAVLLNGELRLGAVLKVGDRIPDEVREKFGIQEEFVTDNMDTKRRYSFAKEGNVIDASDVFSGRKPGDSIH